MHSSPLPPVRPARSLLLGWSSTRLEASVIASSRTYSRYCERACSSARPSCVHPNALRVRIHTGVVVRISYSMKHRKKYIPSSLNNRHSGSSESMFCNCTCPQDVQTRSPVWLSSMKLLPPHPLHTVAISRLPLVMVVCLWNADYWLFSRSGIPTNRYYSVSRSPSSSSFPFLISYAFSIPIIPLPIIVLLA